MATPWTAALHRRIVTAVKEARRRRGLSAHELSDKTRALGFPVSRSQIANYESGRRRSLDVAELLVLACALDVPALSLLFPDDPDKMVEFVPGKTMTTSGAVAEFTGDPNSHGPHVRIRSMIEELESLITTASSGRGRLSAHTSKLGGFDAEE